jgi:hypothetical protein
VVCGRSWAKLFQEGSDRDRAPKLSGSKFIKQASSDKVDSVQRLSPENKGGVPYKPFRAGYRNGGVVHSLSHT